jgi:hypothetical protein
MQTLTAVHHWLRAGAALRTRVTLLLLALCAVLGSTVDAAESAGVVAYRALSQVSYRGIGGGQIEASLQPAADGTWIYETHAFPNVLGRLAISDAAHERGRMQITADGVRPLSYDYDAGRSDGDKDIHIEFDWDHQRAQGSHQGRAFAHDVTPGTQDTASVQAAMLQYLAEGRAPQSFRLVTSGKVRDYRYWSEGTARLKTPIGEVDTVIWANQGEGSSRVSKVWHAPALGYVPVQAIQYRDGRAELQMRLIKLDH